MAVQELTGRRIILTYKDYCALPDDRQRYEILEGELFVSPAPSPFHQTIIVRLASLLHSYVEREQLGRVFVAPCDVLLADTTVVQPDILFVARERLGNITRRYVQGAPDLVVEVTSPWNPEYDAVAKRQLYAKFGIMHYWMLDSENPRLVELADPQDGAYRAERTLTPAEVYEPKLFPGLRVDLGRLFAD